MCAIKLILRKFDGTVCVNWTVFQNLYSHIHTSGQECVRGWHVTKLEGKWQERAEVLKQCIEIKGSQMEPDFLASVRSIRKPRIIIHDNLCHMSDN